MRFYSDQMLLADSLQEQEIHQDFRVCVCVCVFVYWGGGGSTNSSGHVSVSLAVSARFRLLKQSDPIHFAPCCNYMICLILGTAVISLKNINHLASVMETQFGLCSALT